MALPSNDHHVHSDGYRSDRLEYSKEAMLERAADDFEEIDGVDRVEANVNNIEMDMDGETATFEEICAVVDDWNLTIGEWHSGGFVVVE